MIEKIEPLQSEKSKRRQSKKKFFYTYKYSQTTNHKLILFLSLIKTGLFLILLLVVGVFSIPFAILASQVDKIIGNDRP